MRYEILFTDSHFKEISEHFEGSKVEQVALLLAGVNANLDRTRLLVNYIYKVPSHEFIVQQEDRFEVKSEVFRMILKKARSENLSIILAHCHPSGILSIPARFSEADLNGEMNLLEDFSRLNSQPNGAIVFGAKGTIDARVWVSGAQVPVSLIRVIGRQIRLFRPTSSPEKTSFNPSQVYNRQMLAFGSEGQVLIEATKVAVVGAGGTGSFVGIQLAHLGVKNLQVFEFDNVESSNLNRLLGANLSDADKSSPKTNVLKRYIEALDPEIKVKCFNFPVDTMDGIRAIVESDIIFCCTDSMASRAVLNQIAHQFYIPVIDMAAGIDSPHSRIVGGGGYVKAIVPEGICLYCNGDLQPSLIANEKMPEPLREAAIQAGYCKAIKNPSVISLNGTVSSFAVTKFLDLLFGFGDMSILEYQNYYLLTGKVRVAKAGKKNTCPFCQDSKGRGGQFQLFQI